MRPASYNNPSASHCDGKAAFDSASLAIRVAGRKTRRNGSRHPYHCPSCGKWHLAGRRPDFHRKQSVTR